MHYQGVYQLEKSIFPEFQSIFKKNSQSVYKKVRLLAKKYLFVSQFGWIKLHLIYIVLAIRFLLLTKFTKNIYKIIQRNTEILLVLRQGRNTHYFP